MGDYHFYNGLFRNVKYVVETPRGLIAVCDERYSDEEIRRRRERGSIGTHRTVNRVLNPGTVTKLLEELEVVQHFAGEAFSSSDACALAMAEYVGRPLATEGQRLQAAWAETDRLRHVGKLLRECPGLVPSLDVEPYILGSSGIFDDAVSLLERWDGV